MPPKRPTSKPKANKTVATAGGLPLCIAIFPCENVIVGEDKTVSAIRIIDTLSLPAGSKLADGQGLDFSPIRFFASLKAGTAQGKIPLLLACIDPSGKSEAVGSAEITFEGGSESGAHINTPLRIHWGGPGVYWLEIRANDTPIARTPLKVVKPD